MWACSLPLEVWYDPRRPSCLSMHAPLAAPTTKGKSGALGCFVKATIEASGLVLHLFVWESPLLPLAVTLEQAKSMKSCLWTKLRLPTYPIPESWHFSKIFAATSDKSIEKREMRYFFEDSPATGHGTAWNKYYFEGEFISPELMQADTAHGSMCHLVRSALILWTRGKGKWYFHELQLLHRRQP